MLISKFDNIMLCKMLTLVDAECSVNENFLCNVCSFSVSLKLVKNKSYPPTHQKNKLVWKICVVCEELKSIFFKC